jgi:hypothetical protein
MQNYLTYYARNTPNMGFELRAFGLPGRSCTALDAPSALRGFFEVSKLILEPSGSFWLCMPISIERHSFSIDLEMTREK